MRVEPIDLRPFRDGSDTDRRRVAEQFDRVARTSGFLSITGHGVDPDLCAEMLDVTAQYFDLPATEKMAHFVEDRAANRGYAPEGSEALAYSLGEADLPTDLFEAFNCGLELTDEQLADPYFAAKRNTLFATNVWPLVPAASDEFERGQVAWKLIALACSPQAMSLGAGRSRGNSSLGWADSTERAHVS